MASVKLQFYLYGEDAEKFERLRGKQSKYGFARILVKKALKMEQDVGKPKSAGTGTAKPSIIEILQ